MKLVNKFNIYDIETALKSFCLTNNDIVKHIHDKEENDHVYVLYDNNYITVESTGATLVLIN